MKYSEKAMNEAVRRASTVFDVMMSEDDRTWREICEAMLREATPVLVKDVFDAEMEAGVPAELTVQPLQMDDPEYDYPERKPRQPWSVATMIFVGLVAVVASIGFGGWAMYMVMTA